MLYDASGRLMRNPHHSEEFYGWLGQLEDLSLAESGDRHAHYNAIRDQLYCEMDEATSSFVYSSWIPGTIWPRPFDKIYECLGTGADPGQWNVVRWFYGLLLEYVMIHRRDQVWEAFPKTGYANATKAIPKAPFTGAVPNSVTGLPV